MLHDELEQMIDHMWEVRDSSNYDGDYSLTLTAEGYSCSVPLEDITWEVIEGDTLLIHINSIDC